MLTLLCQRDNSLSKRVQLRSRYYQRANGISNTSRMELLFEWWEASRDQRFVEFALKLAREPVSGLDSWRDGSEAIELIGKLRDGACFDGLPLAGELADAL